MKERLCCKRVRTWETSIKNPLLDHRKSVEAVKGTKREKRMHTSKLLCAILEIYEQMIHIESVENTDLCRKEHISEVVVRHMNHKAVNK